MSQEPNPDDFTPVADERWRMFRSVSFRTLIPNMITLLAICSGLTAVRLSAEGRLDWAVGAVVIAAILDALDGRVARMLKGTSKFGAELDSLCDFVNFGVVPALMLYFFSFHSFGNVGWIVGLIFAIACALRLARFNVMLDDPNKPAFTKDFFTGIPAPAGALCAMLPIYLNIIGLDRFRGMAAIEMIFVLFIAAMMVSRVPTYAGKTLGQSIPREKVLLVLLLIVVGVVLLVSYPFQMLTAGVAAYLLTLPLGIARYNRLEREHKVAFTESASQPTGH
ncbi:MAG: CDP-diacylglycerol--serine O-phosphatidyltransferase [Beijerinckiaceae bacterium]